MNNSVKKVNNFEQSEQIVQHEKSETLRDVVQYYPRHFVTCNMSTHFFWHVKNSVAEKMSSSRSSGARSVLEELLEDSDYGNNRFVDLGDFGSGSELAESDMEINYDFLDELSESVSCSEDAQSELHSSEVERDLESQAATQPVASASLSASSASVARSAVAQAARRACFTLQLEKEQFNASGAAAAAAAAANPVENARRFCEQLVDQIASKDFVRFVILQLEEAPTTGRWHVQGYVEAKKPQRFRSRFERDFHAHWENARGSKQQNIDYCSKAESRVCGPFMRGDASVSQGSRSDLKKVSEELLAGKSLREVGLQHGETFIRYNSGMQKLSALVPRALRQPPRVIVMWGPTGTGKTRAAFSFDDDIYIKPSEHWFDGYVGQKVLLVDEMTTQDIPISFVLRMCDRYPMQLPVKGSYSHLDASIVIFTSNISPLHWWRWAADDLRPQRTEVCGAHYVAFGRRVTELWYFPGVGIPVRKLIRSREFDDPVDVFFQQKKEHIE